MRISFSKGIVLFSVLTAVAAGVGVSYAISRFLLNEAKKDVRDILLSHRGLHQYIQRNMHPGFYRARAEGLISPQYYDPVILSSSYIVRLVNGYHNEERKRLGLGEVYYKMAATNPRNPVNQADSFEAGILEKFNDDRSLKEYQLLRRIGGRTYLFFALPFLETGPACLKCHGRREDAPPGLRALYPGEGGFNDRVGNIRAIESIMVPLEDQRKMGYVVSGAVSAGIVMMLLLSLINTRLRVLVKKSTHDLEEQLMLQKRNEAVISGALQEREVLLREIHHRVKNNLAIISSLIDMKAGSVRDSEAQQIFRDCRQRIKVIARVHETLYHRQDLKHIGVREYITSLIEDIRSSYAGAIPCLRISSVSDELMLSVDELMLLGLVLNEIIVNAIKHAFVGIEAPLVSISVRNLPGHRVAVNIADNGRGFPDSMSESGNGGIGVELVQGLVRQLGGELSVESSGGVRYSIVFTVKQHES